MNLTRIFRNITRRHRRSISIAILSLTILFLSGCASLLREAPESPVVVVQNGEPQRFVVELWSERTLFFAPGFPAYELRPVLEDADRTDGIDSVKKIDLGRIRGDVEQAFDALSEAMHSRPCWMVSFDPPAVAGVRDHWELNGGSPPPTIGDSIIPPMVNIWLGQDTDLLVWRVDTIAVADSVAAAKAGDIRVIDLPSEMSLDELFFQSEFLADALARSTRERARR